LAAGGTTRPGQSTEAQGAYNSSPCEAAFPPADGILTWAVWSRARQLRGADFAGFQAAPEIAQAVAQAAVRSAAKRRAESCDRTGTQFPTRRLSGNPPRVPHRFPPRAARLLLNKTFFPPRFMQRALRHSSGAASPKGRVGYWEGMLTPSGNQLRVSVCLQCTRTASASPAWAAASKSSEWPWACLRAGDLKGPRLARLPNAPR